MSAAVTRLCRHVHLNGCTLSLRYTLSDGTYVGEIDVTAAGGAEVWQMLGYDLMQVTSACAQGEAPPAPGSDSVLHGIA